MENIALIILLLVALAMPIALFLLLRSRLRLGDSVAALVAIAVGWALNVVWALASEKVSANGLTQAEDILSIAAYFGWVCPTVLVFLTWVVWRFLTRRGA